MSFVNLRAEAKLPTKYGLFDVHAYEGVAGEKYVVLRHGNIEGASLPLVRLHSECLTGDVFFSERCDCGPQLEEAFRRIQKEGKGIIIYLPHEGRGIGFINKIRAYALQDKGADTIEANLALGLPSDARDYEVTAEVLRMEGISKFRLLTNNLEKVKAMQAAGFEVERVSLEVPPSAHNKKYLLTKKNRFGHALTISE